MATNQDHGQFSRRAFLNLLENIESPGTFAAFGHFDPIYPDIAVSGRSVRVPLRPNQAVDLIKHARQAPFGRGAETIVDRSVRNTWELDPSQFEITNPAWDDAVTKACAFVAKELGIAAPITAELYKMLIYEKGAMFKPHTDSEKIPGMFGTLIICLPSPHQGGDLVLKHNNETKTFKTSATPVHPGQCCPTIACWYADVNHEVRPVTEGYRWVLTYNLAAGSPVAAAPSASPTYIGEVRRRLVQWLHPRDSKKRPERMYYRLDHHYTTDSLRYHALKGADRTRVDALKDAAAGLGVQLLLAVFTKKERGETGYNKPTQPGWHEFVEEPLSEYTIHTVVDLDGGYWAESREVEGWELKKYALQAVFADGERWEQGYTGFMGNSGALATHWYRSAMVMLVPSTWADVKAVVGNDGETDVWQARRLVNTYLFPGVHPEPRLSRLQVRALKELMYLAYPEEFPPSREDDTGVQLLRIAALGKHYKLYARVVRKFGKRLKGSPFAFVAEGMRENRFDFWGGGGKVCRSLTEHLDHFPMQKKVEFIALLGDPENCSRGIQEWIDQQLRPSCRVSPESSSQSPESS